MTDYSLTPFQSLLLRSLDRRNVEASPMELSVDALVPLSEVESLVTGLAKRGLVRPVGSPSATGQAFELTSAGRAVVRALDAIKGTPAVGSHAKLPHANLLAWITGQRPKYVQIVSEHTA